MLVRIRPGLHLDPAEVIMVQDLVLYGDRVARVFLRNGAQTDHHTITADQLVAALSRRGHPYREPGE